MNITPKLAIMASAGSGKTHALVSRMMKILSCAEPGQEGRKLHETLAMTFTRVAAGEIFDELMMRIAKAAASKDDEERGKTDLSREQCAAILKGCVEEMHRASIGTLDGFFAGIVQSFPLELGISPDFSLLSDTELASERDRILRKLLAAGRDDASSKAFMEDFKLSTFGREGRKCHELLDDLISSHHDLLLQCPDESRWGSCEAIWQRVNPPFALLNKEELAALKGELLDAIANAALSDSQEAKLIELVASLADLQPGSQMSEGAKGSFKELAKTLKELEKGSARPKGFTKPPLPQSMQEPLAEMLKHGLACMLRNCVSNTLGVYRIVKGYEDEYRRSVRQSGRLTFSDLPFLLGDGRLLGASQESGRSREEAILDVEFRLDGRHNHWALDEFQDTSRRQWRAIANLADEVIQRSEEGRSFFMVGDVKQAIFGWRGGDSRLMTEIIAKYDLDREDISDSWRSCPPVLDLVNGVCSHFSQVDGLSESAKSRWEDLWRKHTPAPPKAKQQGCAFVLESKYKRNELVNEHEITPEQQRAGAIIAELQRIEPWKRGLSAAVLVRGNDEGINLTAALREEGIDAAWQGKRSIAEHPLVAALLALCRYLEHPGSTMDFWHAKMSPLGQLFDDAGGSFLMDEQRLLAEHGFAAAIESWLDAMAKSGRISKDDLAAQELVSLLDAAVKFDAAGGHGGSDFSKHLEGYEIKAQAADGCVQVMTIHGSKGLGFDIVLLSLSESSGGGGGEAMLLGPPDESLGDGSPSWLLSNPGVLAEVDETLKAAAERNEAEEEFESLCVLYVALTRAKREMAVVMDKAPEKGTAIRLSTLVRFAVDDGSVGDAAPGMPDGFTLLGSKPFGDLNWFEGASPRKEASVKELVRELPPAPPATRRRRRLPSAQEQRRSPAKSLFRRASEPSQLSGKDYGIAVHKLFQALEWPGSEREAMSEWRKSCPEIPVETARVIARQFGAAMESPAAKSLLSPPQGAKGALWREQGFDVVIGGEWISGVFDRVQIELDEEGNPQAATIIDFKSEGSISGEFNLPEAVESYSPQMRLYSKALSKMLQLDECRIKAALLFTSIPETVFVQG